VSRPKWSDASWAQEILRPLSREEREIVGGEPGVAELADSVALRSWLKWQLSLWGEQIPALAVYGPTDSVLAGCAEEIRAWAWWGTRLSLAEQVGIARLVYGVESSAHLAPLFGVARAYARDWLAALDRMPPAALWQSVLFARELCDPWASAIRDGRFGSAAEWLRLGALAIPHVVPSPPVPAPEPARVEGLPPMAWRDVGASTWTDYLDGAAEFAGVAWRTVSRTAIYHTERAAAVLSGGDAERVTIDGRDTLFDAALVSDWGRLGELQLAGRMAEVDYLLGRLPVGSVPGSAAGSAHRPSASAGAWLPGVQEWMSDVGSYSRRLELRRGVYLQELGPGASARWVIPPADVLAPREEEQDEIMLQALCLGGLLYVGGTAWPRLRAAAALRAAQKAAAEQAALAALLAEAGRETGVGYTMRRDPRTGGTYIEPLRKIGSQTGGLLARGWRALAEWWRFRRGARIDFELLLDSTKTGSESLKLNARLNEIASGAGEQLMADVPQALSALGQAFASPAAQKAAIQAPPIMAGLPTWGIPMLAPSANVAGLATGPVAQQLGQGGGAILSHWRGLLAAGGALTAYIGSVGYSMWAWEEGSQAAGFAMKQGSMTHREDLVQEAARVVEAHAAKIRGGRPWLPGLNVLEAWSDYAAASLLQARAFRSTAGGVQGLAPDRLSVDRARVGPPSLLGPAGPAPGGSAKTPSVPRAPEVATPVGPQIVTSVWPSIMMDRDRLMFIAAENRETALLNEYADLFAQGSRLLFSDEGFVWPARARVKGAGPAGIVNTGPALRVYLLPDGRVIVRLPKEHALFGPLHDRMRRLYRSQRGSFVRGISDLTRGSGLIIVQPEGHGILGEILLNTNDVPIDQLTETERKLSALISQTNADGDDWVLDPSGPRTE